MTAKSDRVKKLLNNKDLQQAFDDVRDALLKMFTECKTTDSEKMVDIRKRLHLLESVEANLKRAIEDGELEDFRATEQEAPTFLGDIKKWRKKRHRAQKV